MWEAHWQIGMQSGGNLQFCRVKPRNVSKVAFSLPIVSHSSAGNFCSRVVTKNNVATALMQNGDNEIAKLKAKLQSTNQWAMSQ